MEINLQQSKVFELQMAESAVTVCCSVGEPPIPRQAEGLSVKSCAGVSLCFVSGFSYQSSGTKAVPVAFQTTG